MRAPVKPIRMPHLSCLCGCDYRKELGDGVAERVCVQHGLAVRVIKATNAPRLFPHTGRKSETSVIVELFSGSAQHPLLARAKTHRLPDGVSKVWDEVLTLEWQSDYLPADLRVRFILDAKAVQHNELGMVVVPMEDLLEWRKVVLLVQDRHSNPILCDEIPRMPCELEVAVEPDSIPPGWPAPKAEEALPKNYPSHVFMMTRGTRGDVQPFIALARGMAIRKGWLVTICTEAGYKDLVVKNATGVEPGRIQFRCSGGDTEGQMAEPLSEWATKRKTELMQMTIMACSEANFFNTCSTFINEVKRLASQGMEVKLLIAGLTLTAVTTIVSEVCGVPMMSFNLQPSSIPSKDSEWLPVHAIASHPRVPALDKVGMQISNHSALKVMKGAVEHNYLAKDNIRSLRAEFGLPDADTWEIMQQQNVPIVIPMQPKTFDRPSDWWPEVVLTDFIFLRNGQARGQLDDQIATFIEKAQEAGANIGLMTFSSMRVSRGKMLTCAVNMVRQCKFNLRLIYVGKRGHITEQRKDVEHEAEEHRFLDVEGADFGTLFNFIDVFIVHGGLGTTVEALRKKKPVAVTGPMLMDQRFWGKTVHEKGIGPEPCHIRHFQARCVDFVNNALDPEDPMGWRAKAKKASWGVEEDDGVKKNVDKFVRLYKGLRPICTRK